MSRPPTLRKAQSSIDAQLHVSVNLGAVDDGPVSPEAEPVVVGQRGTLLEGIQEHNGDDEGQADGLEVLHVHLQSHLE